MAYNNPRIQPTIIPVSPTTGQTVAFNNSSASQTLYITPASGLLALTINLPSNSSSVLGQIAYITATDSILTLTLANAASIIGTVTGMAADSFASFQKVDNDTWMRIG